MYHGPDRNRSKAWLSSQDVVLTTYTTLAGDMGAVSDVQCCAVLAAWLHWLSFSGGGRGGGGRTRTRQVTWAQHPLAGES